MLKNEIEKILNGLTTELSDNYTITFEKDYLEKVVSQALSQILEIVEKEIKDEKEEIYCELRGLLKEHAQFPHMWDTNKELKNWLSGIGEL